ncbi:MAG: cytochrome c [Janthinobacterium lividum]
MSKTSFGVIVVSIVLALAGCAKKDEAPTLHASMKGVMEPNAETIWDLVSASYNIVGDGLVTDKLSDADWKTIADSSSLLKERADQIALAPHIVVSDAKEGILGSQDVGKPGKIGIAWDAVDAKTVQGRIDAQPELFKEKARGLANAAAAINHAAQMKDAALLYKATSGLDEVCDSCHEPFWGTDEPPAPPRF